MLDFPEGAFTADDIPEEHNWLTIKVKQVWTVADLSMHNLDTFHGLECLLSSWACNRVADRLRQENPDAWRTWPTRKTLGAG